MSSPDSMVIGASAPGVGGIVVLRCWPVVAIGMLPLRSVVGRQKCFWMGQVTDVEVSYTTLYCNNRAAVHLAEDDKYHTHTKHLDIRYHFIRQTIKKK
jgi:hypothetical protein